MTRQFVEILITVVTAVEAGLLLFIAEVVQKLMNELEPERFRWFLGRLEFHAMRSPTALAGSLLTTVACIPYFILFGFGNGWFTAGIVLWLAGAVGSKLFNTPIYRRVAALGDTDTVELGEQRRRLGVANLFRSLTTLAAVVLMLVGLA
jgi:hypothetical protein